MAHYTRGRPWRVALGRAHPGLYGIARSYEEAREAFTMAGRLHVDKPVVNAHDLLIYRVLLRDQSAIVDLVHAVLSPLVQARGGAAPLVATLDAYFTTGGVATEPGDGVLVIGTTPFIGEGFATPRAPGPRSPRRPVH